MTHTSLSPDFPVTLLPSVSPQCFLHDPSHTSSLSPTPLLLASTFPRHTMQTYFHFSHWTGVARCTDGTCEHSGYDFWIPPFNLIIVSISLRIYIYLSCRNDTENAIRFWNSHWHRVFIILMTSNWQFKNACNWLHYSRMDIFSDIPIRIIVNTTIFSFQMRKHSWNY